MRASIIAIVTMGTLACGGLSMMASHLQERASPRRVTRATLQRLEAELASADIGHIESAIESEPTGKSLRLILVFKQPGSAAQRAGTLGRRAWMMLDPSCDLSRIVVDWSCAADVDVGGEVVTERPAEWTTGVGTGAVPVPGSSSVTELPGHLQPTKSGRR
jgi:hypothetical protein